MFIWLDWVKLTSLVPDHWTVVVENLRRVERLTSESRAGIHVICLIMLEQEGQSQIQEKRYRKRQIQDKTIQLA
jgi:hypothetical protein